jgi:transposase InsO family protein
MSRPKKINDSAQIESFFDSFKVERLKRKLYSSDNDVRRLFSSYIRYYNYERSHSSVGYVSPMEYESKKVVSQVGVHYRVRFLRRYEEAQDANLACHRCGIF